MVSVICEKGSFYFFPSVQSASLPSRLARPFSVGTETAPNAKPAREHNNASPIELTCQLKKNTGTVGYSVMNKGVDSKARLAITNVIATMNEKVPNGSLNSR